MDSEEVKFLKKVIRAQDRLLITYRIGQTPPEWVLDTLAKFRKYNKNTPASQQGNKADGKSDTPCSFCHGELTLDPCPLCGN